MPRKNPPSRRPRRLLRMLVWLLVAMTLAACAAAWLAYRQLDRMPGELLRYAERRLYGHTKLEAVALPVIHLLRTQVERPVPPVLADLGKGAQARALPPVRFDGERPVGVAGAGTPAPPATASVASLDELQRAMRAARPGDVIELMPGQYPLTRTITTPVAGNAGAPITVRAAVPQQVQILVATQEGFVVRHPYWVFENLLLRGTCKNDGDCEHAFHVVGAARGTVIRNNRIEDFNAQIKVNGDRGQYPDDGLVQFNTLENSRPRATPLPVTPFDLVAASNWIVADNLVANFHKAQGNGVSYGLFMKGGGSNGRIERNLVICSRSGISQTGSQPGSGVRVGISLGGGGSGTRFCRGGHCDAEHAQGLVANNVIAHCNDAGIDVNASVGSLVAHNTLVNTGWIDVRNAPASATVQGNWLEGRVRARNDGWVETLANETASLARYTEQPDTLTLGWTTADLPLVAASTAVPQDFCGRTREARTPAGAIGRAPPPCGAPGGAP